MFSTVCASLLLALVFSILAVEVPPVQSLMLLGACFAATIFCCALEAWSCQEAPGPDRAQSPENAHGRDIGQGGTN
jgi:hypothetical protein